MCYRQKALVPLIAAVLTGCAGVEHTPVRVVEVPVYRYVSVPAEMTTPVPVAEPTNPTVGECVRVARLRKAQLQQCNIQLNAIRDLGLGDGGG